MTTSTAFAARADHRISEFEAPRDPVFIGPAQIALAHTPAEAAHIRLHLDRLMKEGQPA